MGEVSMIEWLWKDGRVCMDSMRVGEQIWNLSEAYG